VGEVSESVLQLQAETRHNSEQVSHAAMAAGDMRARVQELQQAVDRFKV